MFTLDTKTKVSYLLLKEWVCAPSKTWRCLHTQTTSLDGHERSAFVSLFSCCPKETGVLAQGCVGISTSSANFRNSLPPTASLQF